jgi:hypothetical protein
VDEEQSARELVEAHLRGRTRWTLAVGAVLLVLTVGGCGEFWRSLNASEALAHSGVKVQARIDSASNYERRSLTEGYLYVTYETAHGEERHVRVWLPEDTNYRAGQEVEVAYDAKSPRRAVLAKGGDPGPITFWSFMAFLISAIFLCVLVPMRWRRISAVRRALTRPPTREPVLTELDHQKRNGRRSPWPQRHVFVGHRSFWAMATRSGWHLPDGTAHDLLLFGGGRDEGMAVVDLATRSVAISGGQ